MLWRDSEFDVFNSIINIFLVENCCISRFRYFHLLLTTYMVSDFFVLFQNLWSNRLIWRLLICQIFGIRNFGTHVVNGSYWNKRKNLTFLDSPTFCEKSKTWSPSKTALVPWTFIIKGLLKASKAAQPFCPPKTLSAFIEDHGDY